MKKLIETVIGIVTLFPKFFTAIVILSLLLGPHQMHHMLAVGWDTATTVIFGSPGIPVNKWIHN